MTHTGLNAKMAVPESNSQRYTRNIYLNNNVEDIVVFLAVKMFISVKYAYASLQ